MDYAPEWVSYLCGTSVTAVNSEGNVSLSVFHYHIFIMIRFFFISGIGNAISEVQTDNFHQPVSNESDAMI